MKRSAVWSMCSPIPDFYARDRTAFAARAELANAQAELAAAEEDWLRLELLREEIQGG
jgi:ATP-binding cassette subfamily F protein uup